MQTLLLSHPHLNWRQRIAVTAQFRAWLNFSLIPAAVLLSVFVIPNGAEGWLAELAALSLLVNLFDTAKRLAVRGVKDGHPVAAMLGALATRIALAPASARATIEACLPIDLLFVVTRKSVTHAMPRPPFPRDHVILFLRAVLAAPTAAQSGLLVQLGWLGLALPLPAAVLTEAELTRHRECCSRLAVRT